MASDVNASVDSRLSELLQTSGDHTPLETATWRDDAHRLGMPLADFLITRKLVSKRDVYHHLYKLGRDIIISRAEDLPEWDVVLNDVGQPLRSTQTRGEHILLLGLGSDLNLGLKHVYALATSRDFAGLSFAEAASGIILAGYDLRARIVADSSSLLEVVISQWRNRTSGRTRMDRGTKSDLHKAWNHIIQRAHEMGASDIHLKGTLGIGTIHFRVHGELEQFPYPLTEQQAIELASSLYNTLVDDGSTGDGFTLQKPQDAVITWSLPDGNVRLRYAGLPIEPSGIDVTLRLLPIGMVSKPKPLQSLGYSDDQAEDLERIFYRSSGLILFVGTTGSGKTTSMTNELARLVAARPGKKLRTVEEPVEIRIDGASQHSVTRRTESGTEFNDVLRGLMRSDPDYLGIGEIRDAVTASLAIQAVRSGHLTISSLHADGALMSYDRLEGLGVARLDMAKVGLIAAFVYQRLVPLLCPECKIPVNEVKDTPAFRDIYRRLLQYLADTEQNHSVLEGIYVRDHHGCSACKQRGIINRTVCAEIFVPTPSAMRLVAAGDSTGLWVMWRSQINPSDAAVMRGKTAFEHALWKMANGLVSPVDVEKEFKYLDEKAFDQGGQ